LLVKINGGGSIAIGRVAREHRVSTRTVETGCDLDHLLRPGDMLSGTER